MRSERMLSAVRVVLACMTPRHHNQGFTKSHGHSIVLWTIQYQYIYLRSVNITIALLGRIYLLDV